MRLLTLLIIVAFLVSFSGEAKAAELIWYQDYEDGFDGGEPFSLGGSLHGNPCGSREIRSFGGSKALYAETTVSTCSQNPIRLYRSYHASNQIKLPLLITFWIYVDADSWQQAAGDRFSQLTVKERGDQGKVYHCVGGYCDGGYDDGEPCEDDNDCRNNARIFTTHFRSDGTMDFGHSTMSFRSKTIKAPLRKWNLQSTYIENYGGKTHVTLWSDEKEAVRATVDRWFEEGYVRDWHIGMYTDREGNSGPFAMYNDDLKFWKVSDINEARDVISAELEGVPVGNGNGCTASCGDWSDPANKCGERECVRKDCSTYTGTKECPKACKKGEKPPCDGCVKMDELVEFIDRWKVSIQDVSINELMEGISNWKSGAGCIS